MEQGEGNSVEDKKNGSFVKISTGWLNASLPFLIFKLSVAAGYFLLTLFITNSRQNMMNGILSWDLI